MKKDEYLTNLPKVKEYDKVMVEAHRELFSFLVELEKKYSLTPTQELLILNRAINFTLEQCSATEKRAKGEK